MRNSFIVFKLDAMYLVTFLQVLNMCRYCVISKTNESLVCSTVDANKELRQWLGNFNINSIPIVVEDCHTNPVISTGHSIRSMRSFRSTTSMSHRSLPSARKVKTSNQETQTIDIPSPIKRDSVGNTSTG